MPKWWSDHSVPGLETFFEAGCSGRLWSRTLRQHWPLERLYREMSQIWSRSRQCLELTNRKKSPICLHTTVKHCAKTTQTQITEMSENSSFLIVRDVKMFFSCYKMDFNLNFQLGCCKQWLDTFGWWNSSWHLIFPGQTEDLRILQFNLFLIFSNGISTKITGQKRLVTHHWDHFMVFVRLFRANLTFCTLLLDFVHCAPPPLVWRQLWMFPYINLFTLKRSYD